MAKVTLGVFHVQADAERAIDELRGLGIKDDEISYVTINQQGTIQSTNAAGEAGHSTASDVGSGAVTGGVIGAIAGLVVATGVLPGLGALIAAGPIAAALGLTGAAATTAAGAITGAVAGGLVGALVHLGVHKEDAEMYETEVRNGGILVIAESTGQEIKDIFQKFHADQIKEYNS